LPRTKYYYSSDFEKCLHFNTTERVNPAEQSDSPRESQRHLWKQAERKEIQPAQTAALSLFWISLTAVVRTKSNFFLFLSLFLKCKLPGYPINYFSLSSHLISLFLSDSAKNLYPFCNNIHNYFNNFIQSKYLIT